MNETNKRNKEKGFGIGSILLGIVAAGIIGTGLVTSINSTIDTAKEANVYTFFTDGINSAVALCYTSANSFAGCDKSRIEKIGNIKTAQLQTEWDDTWTVTSVASQTTIVYPLDSSDDADVIGASLVTKLTSSSVQLVVTYDITTSDLTVVYSF